MTAPLILGGPLAIRCSSCGEERGNECRTKPGSRGGFHTTTPHAARVKAAPPIVEAHVGDLVLVRYRGEHVAQLVEIGTVLSVRFWRPSAQVFAAPRLLEREAVIGPAPDDARTALAREELRLEDRRKFIDEPVGAGGTHLRSRLRTSDDPPALAPEIAPGMVGVFTINSSKLADVTNIEIVEGARRFTVAPDIAEGRGPFDPGQDTSDPSPTTPDAPPDPWFTSDSAPTKAPPKGW